MTEAAAAPVTPNNLTELANVIGSSSESEFWPNFPTWQEQWQIDQLPDGYRERMGYALEVPRLTSRFSPLGSEPLRARNNANSVSGGTLLPLFHSGGKRAVASTSSFV
jgi:hypothetical protein